MSLTAFAAETHHEMWGGVNHWAVGGVTLVILMILLGALVAFAGGREHS